VTKKLHDLLEFLDED
jgi:hypothetical protein